MVNGGSGLCRTIQVKFIVLSLFIYISGSPIIIVTGSVDEDKNIYIYNKKILLQNNYLQEKRI